MHVGVEEDILWLEVSVNDVELVKMFNGLDQLSCIELGHVNLLGRHLLDEPEHVAPLGVREDKEEVL